jgi:hypothetical protein
VASRGLQAYISLRRRLTGHHKPKMQGALGKGLVPKKARPGDPKSRAKDVIFQAKPGLLTTSSIWTISQSFLARLGCSWARSGAYGFGG